MKKILILLVIPMLLCGLWIAKQTAETAAQAVLARQTAAVQTTSAATVPSTCPQTLPVPETTAPTTVPTLPTETTVPATIPTEPAVLTFTEEEEALLLQIGMAERGSTGCSDCMALVMRTVLNRVESPKFSSSIKGVIYAQDQFTPVMDGSFEEAVPDWFCHQALEKVKQGWDESQGALYYEWCEGESWHSRNLNLLLQHCDTRFYN